MKKVLIAACLVGTAIFGISVFLGLVIAFKAKTPAGYALSGGSSLLILALMLNTKDIMGKSDAVHSYARRFWFVALLASLYLASLSSCSHLILERPLMDFTAIQWRAVFAADITQWAAVFLSIALLAASPVAVSYRVAQFFAEEDD